MKISLLLFIFLHGINCKEDLTKYIENRAKTVSEKLIRNIRSQKGLHDVKFNYLNETEIIGNYSKREIFIFFNTPYVLLDRKLFKISENSSKLLHTFSFEEDLAFVKTSEYNKLGFLLFSTTSGISHIFGLTESGEVFKIQNLVHLNLTDGRFFVCQKNLYLILANSKASDLTSIMIYKFVNSHFDEIEEDLTSGGATLYTFDYSESAIIIVSHNFKALSSIFEFSFDKLKKIQKIDTNIPKTILSYIDQNTQYVIIFDKHNDVILYEWTGNNLLFWSRVNSEKFLEEKIVFYVNSRPYLLLSQNSSAVIYDLKNKEFKLIGKTNFNFTNTWIYNANSSSNSVIMLQSNSDKTNIEIISIRLQENAKEDIIQDDQIMTCFLNLEKAVYEFRSKLKKLDTENDILQQAEPSAKFPARFKNVRTKYATMKTLMEESKQKLVINNTAIVTFPLGVKKVIAKNLHFDKINNKTWQPQNWLSYSSPQTIKGKVKINTLKVNQLETHDDSFNNLLTSKGKQILSGNIKVNNLEVKSIDTKFVNDVPIKNFEDQIESESQTEPKSGPTLRVENLWVDYINGVNFDNFKNSVFKIRETTTVVGNLAFANVRAKNMNFDTLSRKSEVLTIATNQTIKSPIHIDKIFVSNVKTSTVNGLNFKKMVATVNDSTIHGPVSIKNLNVRKNFELQGDINNEVIILNGSHIVGTNESDFLQMYNGKVTIKGNLILNNLDLIKNAKIYLEQNEFEPNFEKFWSKNKNQEVPTHFEAQNGMSTPHLFTNFVNSVNVNDYLFNSSQQKKPAKFYFDNVTIKGNVLLNPDEQHSPDLKNIQKEAVKVNGTFHIKGHKTYVKLLKVDHLEVNDIDVDAPSLIPQTIRNFTVKGNLIAKKLSVQEINKINLESLKKNALYSNKIQNLTFLHFKNVTAENVKLSSTINEQPINQIMSTINKLHNTTKINNVFINGNATFGNIKNLSSINNNDLSSLLEKSNSQFKNNTVFGNVKISGKSKIKDLTMLILNGVNLRNLSKRILYKAWNQTITEPYTFTKLSTVDLVTEKINDVNVKNLIDITNQEPQTIFTSGLTMSKPIKVERLTGFFPCDLEETLKILRNPLKLSWNKVTVINATFLDRESSLYKIFTEVVTNKDKDIVVKGKVRFLNHISANNISALRKVNDIEVMDMIKDAVLNRPNKTQIITGKKIFSILEAQKLKSLKNTNVTLINKLNITKLADNIVYKNRQKMHITGKKTFFTGLQTKNIETDLISGVETKNLVSFENKTEIPETMFESIKVLNNLNISLINGMSFDALLEERLLKKGPKQTVVGTYFLRDVTFNKNIITPRINEIKIEDIVVDSNTQIISGPKTFLEDLKIVGNMRSDLINGLKLSESYEQAVLKNEETNFTGIVQFTKPGLVQGNITTKYINNVPFEYLMQTSSQNFVDTEAEQIFKIAERISNFTHKYLNTTIVMPNEILYLEKWQDLEIPLSNAINAKAVEMKDGVLIHVETEEDGTSCGLPQPCKCPMQQTMQISENSVNRFINKATQRIYNYYDEDIVVHVITHSVSNSSFCRKIQNEVNDEVSTITWNVVPQKNISGGFFVHKSFLRGYLTDVEFFTLWGKTYIVVANYYDPVLDTHSMDTLVLRISEDKTVIEEIQKIPSFAVKTMSLFPTAQGIVLILGSNPEFNNTNTQIFRFDLQKEQFELLRELPTFGSMFAEGIVLEKESLIILANSRSNIVVLKYWPEVDNYYLYQTVQMDYPVTSLKVFYSKDFGISEPYLVIVTNNNEYFIYTFKFIEGWKLEFSGELDGSKILVPFKLHDRLFLFAPSARTSILSLVEHDFD